MRMKNAGFCFSVVHPVRERSYLAAAVILLVGLGLTGCGSVNLNERQPEKKEAAEAEQIQAPSREPFRWPEGKRAAISLTFDDARPSQVDKGLPILDACGVKATFYVSPRNVLTRLDAWKEAAAGGHEIGNHTVSHPCTGNFKWSRETALEDYTLGSMASEIDEASEVIERLLGVKPASFAYPCGQKFVGRGTNVKSYVPMVAERFVVGRGAFDEVGNDPAFCDLAHVAGIQLDGLDFEHARRLVDLAREEGRWLVFFGHEIGQAAHQTTSAQTLEALCQYAREPGSELWIDTVEAIGKYIIEQRSASGQ
jgi:peptidoglycan/xylan/chitin deacetylase (PgdA/CDA1 family)